MSLENIVIAVSLLLGIVLLILYYLSHQPGK